MNCKTEANRLADCHGMDRGTFERDIEMALENISKKSIIKAEVALAQLLALTIKRMNKKHLPKDEIVTEMNQIINQYFKEC